MKKALSIAGSDCSGGAGIQADIKTMTMNGVYAMSAITALTAQNTTGVRAIQESTPEFLKEQLDSVFEDIYPNAVKIGMVSSSELIGVIAERLRFYNAKNVVEIYTVSTLALLSPIVLQPDESERRIAVNKSTKDFDLFIMLLLHFLYFLCYNTL